MINIVDDKKAIFKAFIVNDASNYDEGSIRRFIEEDHTSRIKMLSGAELIRKVSYEEMQYYLNSFTGRAIKSKKSIVYKAYPETIKINNKKIQVYILSNKLMQKMLKYVTSVNRRLKKEIIIDANKYLFDYIPEKIFKVNKEMNLFYFYTNEDMYMNMKEFIYLLKYKNSEGIFITSCYEIIEDEDETIKNDNTIRS